MFQDMISIDRLVLKIMHFAQRLVSADRASLFLVDHRTRELYATVFDVGLNGCKDTDNFDDLEDFEVDDNCPQPIPLHEIRFPLGTGIAGHVAVTGTTLNIHDAYADPRFNRAVDAMTGYKTKTILCMPIFIRGTVIGVMQMVNKMNSVFSKEDEKAFEMFAVYGGLALHHAKLYDKIHRTIQRYKVTLDVLSYHNTSSQEGVLEMIEAGIPDKLPDIDSYQFNPFAHTDFEKARSTIFMFVDLFGLHRFERDDLARFILTIRKNYRRVPYHNWTHGFAVANTMYTVIKRSGDTFHPIEVSSIFRIFFIAMYDRFVMIL